MNANPLPRQFAALLMVAGMYVWSPASVAVDCANPRKAAGTMSESVYKGVQEATELLVKKKHAEAIVRLTELAETGSDYEKAVVNYNLGFAHSGKDDYGSAVKAFAKALSSNALPQQQHEQLQFNLGQLYIAADQFDEGIKTLQSYVTESCGTVPADAHIFLANALSQRKRYSEALPQIDHAVAKSKTIKESWLQLKLAIHYELKDYKGCAQALVQLISIAPIKADYWKQLSGIFLQMKQDTDAMAVLALAERQGFVGKPQEIKNLYSIYMMGELPMKAGMMLQAAIDQDKVPADEKNLESLADAWINARETARAEATLRRLAGMAERGEYYFKLGAMYGDNERWKDSEEMLKKAIVKSGLKRTGEAYIRLAVAQFSQKNIPAAQASLKQALNYDESRRQAGEWLRHLNQAAAPAAPAEQQAKVAAR